MDQAAGPSGGEESDEASNLPKVSNIDPKGDVVLDVTFETSKETLKLARKAASYSRTGGQNLKRRSRFAYRVHIVTLKSQSRYFDNLLGNPQFNEARLVANKLASLSLANISPAEADSNELPWVRIEDDDEATRMAGRDVILADLLRILHGKDVVTKPVTISFATALAVLADRFACAATVSRWLSAKARFKWPTIQPKLQGGEQTRVLSDSSEGLLRQKALAAWLLDQPFRLQTATRQLLIYGSRQWSLINPPEEEGRPIWWDLQDDLETELRYRRECIMNTISSVLGHFLKLYTYRRTRQCKLGYDSSSACDSYQLGEMVRFFINKNLLHLTDFGPTSTYSVPDSCQLDMEEVMATLRQFPGYQIDTNHTNCGLRIRIIPILDYIHTMTSTAAVSISSTAWKTKRNVTAWCPSVANTNDGDGDGEGEKKAVFRFTRAVASDQRLRYEGALAAEGMARSLFTASNWDWTPDDDEASATDSFPGEFRPLGLRGDRIRR